METTKFQHSDLQQARIQKDEEAVSTVCEVFKVGLEPGFFEHIDS